MKMLPAVPVDRIFLHLSNPRFEAVQTEEAAIERLCAEEGVYALAADIVKLGMLNPLERLALHPIPQKDNTAKKAGYIVAEGNRRICALKLLNDPELAPSSLKRKFKTLAAEWTPIKTVSAAVFDQYTEVEIWLRRLHLGPAGGVGRKGWDSEQKSRFSGENKNKLAQDMLDYAEKIKLITKGQRKGLLTTLSRFVNNDVLKEVIGYTSQDGDFQITRPKKDFDKQLKLFFLDIVKKKDRDGKPYSRYNKPDVTVYARGLSQTKGLSGRRTEPKPLDQPTRAKGSSSPKPKPTKPQRAVYIEFDSDIERALKELNNEKLISIYHSIVTVELEHHTPLLYVGAWSFIETLTSILGRNVKVSFLSFLSPSKLDKIGVPKNKNRVSLARAIKNISELGNSTKHDPIAGTFNGDQLNNDMKTIRIVLLKLVEMATSEKK